MNDAQRKLTVGKTDAADELIKQAKELNGARFLGSMSQHFPLPKMEKVAKDCED